MTGSTIAFESVTTTGMPLPEALVSTLPNTFAALAPHGDPSLAGPLAEFPLDALFRLVARSRRTGVLTIGPPRPSVFFFVSGELCGGVAEQDTTLRDAFAAQELTVDGTAIQDLVEDQLVTAIATALIPADSEFAFIEARPQPDYERFRFGLDATMEAAHQRLEAWRVIADVIPSVAQVVRLAGTLPEGVEQVNIDRRDWQIVAAVDGRRSVADVIAVARRSAFDVCSTLYRLAIAGVVDISAGDDPAEAYDGAHN